MLMRRSQGSSEALTDERTGGGAPGSSAEPRAWSSRAWCSATAPAWPSRAWCIATAPAWPSRVRGGAPRRRRGPRAV